MSRKRGLGLRGRVVVTFTIGAVLVAIVLAGLIYATSRNYMVSQRERSAEQQAIAHAAHAEALLALDRSPGEVLDGLALPESTEALLFVDGRWYITDRGVGPTGLPAELRPRMIGTPTVVQTTVEGRPYLAVGVPVGDEGAVLFELQLLNLLTASLRKLELLLLGCALFALGAAVGLVWWASRRFVAPLHEVARTAALIADGDLDRRLQPSADRNLSVINESFNAMVDSLQERIDRERRFFADVSHELRTPLTTLVATVGVLNRHEKDMPPRSRRALSILGDEVDHLRRLLDDLLALARAEAGLHQSAPEPISLQQLLSYTLADAKLGSELLTVGEDVKIRGRKLALERAFLNLIENAERHGWGVSGLTLSRRGDTAIVYVDDHGPGVRPTDRKRIFERFATAHTARKSSPGTGIGLALVAETVAAHGGSVECVDAPGGGARFVVELPRLVES